MAGCFFSSFWFSLECYTTNFALWYFSNSILLLLIILSGYLSCHNLNLSMFQCFSINTFPNLLPLQGLWPQSLNHHRPPTACSLSLQFCGLNSLNGISTPSSSSTNSTTHTSKSVNWWLFFGACNSSHLK